MSLNNRISFLSSLQCIYDHYLPCVLCFLYFHTNQQTSKNSNFENTNTPQRSLNTRFACKNRSESKHFFFHYLLNNQSRRTSVSSESGDRLRQTAWDCSLFQLRFLWEREVWMNVKSPLGRTKRIFRVETKDSSVQSWCALRITLWVAQISHALRL